MAALKAMQASENGLPDEEDDDSEEGGLLSQGLCFRFSFNAAAKYSQSHEALNSLVR